MRNAIKDMLLALADAEVAFVVAGGVAALLHGVERVTMDLDVSADMRPENLRRLLAVMRTQGLRPRVPVPAELLLDPAAVRQIVDEKDALVFTFIDPDDALRHVDLFLTEDMAYERLRVDALTVPIAGRAIAVVSIAQLLALKRSVDPPRPKDRFDIDELERLQREAP